MTYYLNEEECAAKDAELRKLQEDPAYDIELKLIKDDAGWYADVPSHTRGQNAMVAGADVVCERMAEGDNVLVVRFRTVEDPGRKPVATLRRIVHRHGYGAEYLAFGVSAVPFPAYICDVGHDVMGEHPQKIYVYGIEHRKV